MSNDHFKGYVAHDTNAIGNMKYESFQPKNWTEDDVEFKINYCGICASDISTLQSGWGPTNYPVVVGHELVGKVTKVGKDVKSIQVGDIVGVGAQSSACLKCDQCTTHKEPYCPDNVGTYNSKYKDGSPSSGGYADYARVPQHFCIPIPEGIAQEVAAPMLCGGVTVYSPLKQNNVGPGVDVGIIGIGGLGHFAVMFAAALGANVTAISHTHSKEADAKAMGAKHFIATGDANAFSDNKRKFDVIVCTVNSNDMPMTDYLSLLKVHGKLVLVGAPHEPLKLPVFPLLMNGCNLGGSAIGSPKEIQEMLELAQKSNIKTWLKIWKMSEVNEALQDLLDGNARYRHVLKNDS